MVNKAGEVLVQQRKDTGAHAGLWEFPGGKLELGESPEQAAIRELGEELGIAIAAGDLRPVSFASGFVGEPGSKRPFVILLFVCDRWNGTPQPLAATKLAWAEPALLAQWPMPPLDYPLALAVTNLLGENAI